jgi:hypothetical protein
MTKETTMNRQNAKNLLSKTTGLIGGMSVALLLSVPAVAQQGSVDPNSNTSPSPAPAAPNTYSPTTGDPTVRIAPGNNNSVDRTENVNSVQQPDTVNQNSETDNSVAQPYSTSEPANRTRYNDRSTGNTPNPVDGGSRQDTNRMGQYQTTDIRPLQEPAGRSRYDDRSTGFNQANFDRLADMDDNDSPIYPGRNPVRTESRQIDGTTNPIDNQDGSQVKQLESGNSSPNQQNPNPGASEGSGASGNIQSPATPNNGSGRIEENNNYRTPTGSQIPSTQQGNPGTRIGVEDRTQSVDQQRSNTTTVDQQRGNTNINNTAQPSTQPSDNNAQPSSGGEAGSQGAGGSQGVPGLW